MINREYLSPNESYSTLRLLGLPFRASTYSSPRAPGVMKIPIVTGISFFAIRFSITCGRRSGPFLRVARWPAWNTSTQAGLYGVYFAGTYTPYLRTVVLKIWCPANLG